MVRTRVPEAPANLDRDASRREDHVQTSAKVGEGATV